MSPLPSRRGSCSELPAHLVLVFSVVFSLSSTFAQSQNASPSHSADRARIEENFKGLNRGKSVSQVEVSPDGKRLAWVEGARGGGQLLVAPLLDMTKSERVVVAPAKPDQHCRENGIVWAPDSKALAFFSDCGSSNGQEDLYLSKLDGNPVKRLTQLNGFVGSPAFPPDG